MITVFIKHEQVEFGNNLEFHKRNKDLGQESRNARLAEETRAKFQKLCVGPFKDVGPDIPNIAVSSEPQRDL